MLDLNKHGSMVKWLSSISGLGKVEPSCLKDMCYHGNLFGPRVIVTVMYMYMYCV